MLYTAMSRVTSAGGLRIYNDHPAGPHRIRNIVYRELLADRPVLEDEPWRAVASSSHLSVVSAHVEGDNAYDDEEDAHPPRILNMPWEDDPYYFEDTHRESQQEMQQEFEDQRASQQYQKGDHDWLEQFWHMASQALGECAEEETEQHDSQWTDFFGITECPGCANQDQC